MPQHRGGGTGGEASPSRPKDKSRDSSTGSSPIRFLELSPTTQEALLASGITTVAALLAQTDVDLLKTRRIKRKSLNEIKDALFRYGLRP